MPGFHRAASLPTLLVPGASRPGHPCTPSLPPSELSELVSDSPHSPQALPCP